MVSHDRIAFEAFLVEVDETLDAVEAAVLAEPGMAGGSPDVRRRVRAGVDLLRRGRRLLSARPQMGVRQKYRDIARNVRRVLSWVGDAPPQFAQWCVPAEVYEKLYPLYQKAQGRADMDE